MRKALPLLLAFGLFFLPVFGVFAWSWYDDYWESRNSFTMVQVCDLKIGENIGDAWKKLGRPIEYQNYDFSNVQSAQYRDLKRGYFVEIIYSSDEGVVEGIFWGHGRTQTLAESGACAKLRQSRS